MSMGPDERHPRTLKELVHVVAKPLSTIFGKSWQSQVTVKREILHSSFTREGRMTHGTDRPFSLLSVPEKIVEQTLPEALLRHREHREVI